ncbi:MAG TPA: bacterial Ig-like domain-containing protein [Bacilli bacterium]|nr:bacterial Ig-like domain-containing protein [Bacilli bacterium]
MKSILFKSSLLVISALISIGTGATLVSMREDSTQEAQALTVASEVDFTLKTTGHAAYGDSWTYNNWTIFGAANNNNGWSYSKFGGKSATLATANPVYLKNNLLISSAIEKVSVSVVAGSLSKSGMSVTSWGVYVYSDAALTTQTDYVAGGTITASAGVFDFVPTSGTSWAANSYFKVSFNLKNTTTTNGIVYVDKIQLLKADEAPVTLSSIAISGDMTTKNYVVGGSWDYTGLVVTATYSDASNVDVTADTTWTPNPATATDVTVVSLSLTATYADKTAEITIAGITVSAPAGEIVSGGKYLITATASNGTRYILKAGLFTQGNSTTFTQVYSSLSAYSSADAWTFTANVDNQWTITGSDGTNNFGIRHYAANNGVASAAADYCAFAITTAENNAIYLMDTTQERYLTVYPGATPNWRCYAATTAQGSGSKITLVEYEEVTLSSIAVTATPTKTSYYVGQTLDTSGIEVTGTYSNASTENITTGCTYSPTTLSTVGTQVITVTHTVSSQTTTFSVTVLAVTLTSIAVTNMPAQTSYALGNTLITADIVITGTYSNSEQADLTSGCTYSPTTLNTAGTQVITVTHTASNLTTTFSVTVLDIHLTSIAVTTMPSQTTYVVGNSLVTTGIVVTGTYSDSTTADVTSGCAYSPETLNTVGTQTITVTHTASALTTTFDVTVGERGFNYFGTHADFASWDSAYKERALDFNDFTMTFASADKQSTTITNMPVSKGSYAVFASKVLPIKSITFGFAQWTTKTQTISLNKYENGAVPASDVATTLAFPSAGTTITRTFSEVNIMSVKVTMSNASNQIGWDYVNVEFYDTNNAKAFSTAFLASITCDGGVTAPSLANWSAQASNYLALSSDDKYIFVNTVANASGTIIEQCAARYDYIVNKYGDTVYSNFMSRTPAESSTSSTIYANYRYNMTAIIVILLSSLGLTGALFFAKKKKAII